jgi:hypothetical protein
VLFGAADVVIGVGTRYTDFSRVLSMPRAPGPARGEMVAAT